MSLSPMGASPQYPEVASVYSVMLLSLQQISYSPYKTCDHERRRSHARCSILHHECLLLQQSCTMRIKYSRARLD